MKTKTILLIIFSLICLFIACSNEPTQQISQVTTTVSTTTELDIIADSIQKFEIIKRQGNNRDCYLAAVEIAELYLIKKDEINYGKWKKIETKYLHEIEDTEYWKQYWKRDRERSEERRHEINRERGWE